MLLNALEPKTRAEIKRVGRQYARAVAAWLPDESALPVTFDKLASYELICLGAELLPKTIKSYRSKLKRWAGESNYLPDPLDALRLKDWTRSLNKLCDRLPRARHAFRRAHLEEALASGGVDPKSPYEASVWLMANVALEGLLRGKELISELRVRDLFTDDENGYVVYVRKSKANKEGDAEPVCFPRRADVRFSVPDLLDRHMRKIYGNDPYSDPERLLFPCPPRQRRNRKRNDLDKRARRQQRAAGWAAMRSASTWPRRAWIAAVRWLASLTSLDPRLASGHSFRSGGATDMRLNGAPLHLVMAQGRWRDARSVKLYDRWPIGERMAGLRKWGSGVRARSILKQDRRISFARFW